MTSRDAMIPAAISFRELSRPSRGVKMGRAAKVMHTAYTAKPAKKVLEVMVLMANSLCADIRNAAASIGIHDNPVSRQERDPGLLLSETSGPWSGQGAHTSNPLNQPRQTPDSGIRVSLSPCHRRPTGIRHGERSLTGDVRWATLVSERLAEIQECQGRHASDHHQHEHPSHGCHALLLAYDNFITRMLSHPGRMNKCLC